MDSGHDHRSEKSAKQLINFIGRKVIFSLREVFDILKLKEMDSFPSFLLLKHNGINTTILTPISNRVLYLLRT
jgi:hypothetical protein